MTLEEMKKTVSIVDYLQGQGRRLPGRPTGTTAEGVDYYRLEGKCPACGGGENTPHFDVFPETNTFYSRKQCTTGSSIIDLIMIVEGMSEAEAIAELKRLAGDPGAATAKKGKMKPPTLVEVPGAARMTKAAETPADYTGFINSLYHKRGTDSDKYFKNLGISADLIEKYRLCIGPVPGASNQKPRALYSSWQNGRCIHVSGRALTDQQEPKYLNVTGEKPVFNMDKLKQARQSEVIILTEGIKDALLIESVTGRPAVALQGCASHKVKEIIKESKTLILTAFDNDEAGQRTTDDFKEYKAVIMPPEYKDPAEYGRADPEGLKRAIEAAEMEARTAGSVADYLSAGFWEDLKRNRDAIRLKTGFSELDGWLNGGMWSVVESCFTIPKRVGIPGNSSVCNVSSTNAIFNAC